MPLKPMSTIENRGAITGSYTKEEAEQWIVKYKEAMSEILGNDN